MKYYWSVALVSAPYSTLTYAQPEYFSADYWYIGQIVVIPLGSGFRIGVLIQKTPAEKTPFRIKKFLWPACTQHLLDSGYIDLIRDLALRQSETIGRVLANVLPRTFKDNAVTFLCDEKSRVMAVRELSRLDSAERKGLVDQWLHGGMTRKAPGEREEKYCFVRTDPPWPIRPNAMRQWDLMHFLWEKGCTSWKDVCRAVTNANAQTLNALVQKELVGVRSGPYEPEEPEASVHEEVFPLSPEQNVALETLLPLFKDTKPGICLVHGVTGSGKTRVYLELARECLLAGKRVLLLAPEVAIALQLFAEAKGFFHDEEILLYHGYQSPKTREKTFCRMARNDDALIVVGTRSALLLPGIEPGVIILDEEHDASFKQDERLVYHAKEVGYYRIQRSGGLLVLGSATPDLKTFFAAREQEISLVTMTKRIGTRVLPEIRLIDLRISPPVAGPFSASCKKELDAVLAQGEQVIIMHNRRGYAPVLYCEDCGEAAQCPHCCISLTYHKDLNRMVCHYCGFSRPFPMICDHCGGSAFQPVGAGTEKLEEFLSRSLPEGTGVARLDRDSSRRQGQMEKILDDFAKGRNQVLVGTQMLSKGHHFPGVTLVIVIDGDLGLNLPEYRASERTFQLLVQVAGRAGRGDKPGKVFIQTRNPDHHCWNFICTNDYSGFYELEIQRRRRFSYPPFVKLGLLRVSYPLDWSGGKAFLEQFRATVQAQAARLDVRVLGPAPSPLQVLRGRSRFQCLIKAGDWLRIRQLFAVVQHQFSRERNLRFTYDLDPVNML